MKGRHCGWEPSPTSNGDDPWRILLLATILEATRDLDRQPSSQHCIDPLAARAFLLQDAPVLLAFLGLEDHADRLLEMVNSTPEPAVYQISFLEVA